MSFSLKSAQHVLDQVPNSAPWYTHANFIKVAGTAYSYLWEWFGCLKAVLGALTARAAKEFASENAFLFYFVVKNCWFVKTEHFCTNIYSMFDNDRISGQGKKET